MMRDDDNIQLESCSQRKNINTSIPPKMTLGITSSLLFTGTLAAVSSLELFHCLAHLNVVFHFCKNPIAKTSYLYANGWYFYLDWLTVAASTLLVSQLFTRSLPSVFYLLIVSQIIQHLYFCIPWQQRPLHVTRVVEWSCQSPKERSKHSMNDWYHWMGTMFDASIHLLMFFMDVLTIATNSTSVTGTVLLISASILGAVYGFMHYLFQARSKPSSA